MSLGFARLTPGSVLPARSAICTGLEASMMRGRQAAVAGLGADLHTAAVRPGGCEPFTCLPDRLPGVLLTRDVVVNPRLLMGTHHERGLLHICCWPCQRGVEIAHFVM